MAVAITGLANNALLARLLSPQDLGAYFLAFNLVWVGALIGSLGLNQAVIRFVAESVALGRPGGARRVTTVATFFGVLGALGSGLLYLLFGGGLSGLLFDSPVLASVTSLMAGWMVTTSIVNLLAGVFRGFHDIRLAAIFSGPSTGIALFLALGALLVGDGRASLATVVLLAAGSGLLSVLIGGWLLARRLQPLPQDVSGAPPTSEVLNVSWPLLVSGVTVFVLTQADIWIIGVFLLPQDVAVYGAAARLVTLVAMPLLVVNAVVPPIIAELNAQDRKPELERALRAASTFAGMPALVVLVAFALFSGPILGMVYGDFYRAGSLALVLLSLGRISNVWAGSCGLALMMTGHQNTMMNITVLTGLLTVLGAVWAVRGYGTEGVAVVASATMALQNVLMVLFAKSKVGIWTHVSLSPKLLRGMVR